MSRKPLWYVHGHTEQDRTKIIQDLSSRFDPGGDEFAYVEMRCADGEYRQFFRFNDREHADMTIKACRKWGMNVTLYVSGPDGAPVLAEEKKEPPQKRKTA